MLNVFTALIFNSFSVDQVKLIEVYVIHTCNIILIDEITGVISMKKNNEN